MLEVRIDVSSEPESVIGLYDFVVQTTLQDYVNVAPISFNIQVDITCPTYPVYSLTGGSP